MLSFQVQNQLKDKTVALANLLEKIISDCKKVNGNFSYY